MIRDFARRELAPEVARRDRQAEPDPELFAKLASVGIPGVVTPRRYGGAGLDWVALGLACEELEYVDASCRTALSVHAGLCMTGIYQWGTEEQRQRLLRPLAEGRRQGCFALTEPDAGSDPAAMRTSARRDGDDWILNGTKMWITNGSRAGVAVIWAKTDEGIRGFLVPAGSAGFRAVDIHDKLSLVASTTSELVLEDCRVGADALLPGAGSLGAPLRCLNEARYGIVWGAVGAARACLEAALEYTATRTTFGAPIATRQIVQQELVEMHVAVNNGLLLATRIGRLKDEGRVAPEHISYGKFNNVRMATDVARRARALLGANGITLEYPVMRHLVNLESVLTYEGTHQIHALVLGRALTGASAF